jgi:NADH:ubiquinone oxidoreductase subunit K
VIPLIYLFAAAALIGGIGVLCILRRRTLFGVVIGIQILMSGATLMLSVSGIAASARVEGQLSAILVLLGGIAQLAIGCLLSLRLFSERNRILLENVRTLKR